MAAVTSAPFVALLASSWIIVCLAAEEQVKVTSGSNAVLRCQSPRGADIKTIEWTRPDLEVDGYIFFYENNRRQDKYQHPSFHGRVELENESAIKDGDVSMSLKNVTEQDAGTYVCLVSLKKTRRSRRDIPEQLSTITLTVQEPDRWPKVLQSGGVRNEFAGRMVGLSTLLLVLFSSEKRSSCSDISPVWCGNSRFTQ